MFTNVFCPKISFEAEISSSGNGMVSSSNMFVPHQVRPIIGANTYQTVQQKLHSQHPPQQQQQQTQHQSNNLQPNHHQPQHHQPQHHQQQHHHQQHQPPAPSFISTFMPQQAAPMEKSYCSEPTPVVLSSAPKLYLHGPTISLPSNTNPGTDGHSSSQHHSNHHQASSSSSSSAHIDISSLQFDVSQKLKKLKAEKSGPNPIAEAAIQAARASSALQNFQLNEKRKKDKKVCNRMCTHNSWVILLHPFISHHPSIADGPHGRRPSVGGPLARRLDGRRFPHLLRRSRQRRQRRAADAHVQQVRVVHQGESDTRQAHRQEQRFRLHQLQGSHRFLQGAQRDGR